MGSFILTRRLRAIVCITALLLTSSSASPHRNVKRAANGTYDFIIVGGGTAGLALANRLTEVASFSVLVLEAGGPPDAVKSYQAPGSDLQVLGSPIDWAYGTVPQPGLNGRQLTYNQGRCLGGDSAINGIAYTRGSSSIYNLWASLGSQGWSWTDVFPYFKKSTTFNPPTVNNITALSYDASVYSDGPLQIAYSPYVDTYPGSDDFIESLSSIGIQQVQELNAGSNVGTKHESFTIDAKARRSSSYDSYYKQAQNRSNLVVLTGSPLQQLILETADDGAVTATGVVYLDYASGEMRNATAGHEIIMSAGTIKTPYLLMLSGIGPTDVLEKAGMQQKVANENIGKNLQDHIYFSVIAETDASVSSSGLYHDISKLQKATAEFQSGTGPLTAPGGLAFGFEQLSTDILASIGASALTAQNRSNQAHVEMLYETEYFPNLPTPKYHSKEYNTSYVSFTAALLAPTSRGSISVKTNSNTDPPVIDPQYYTTPEDIAIALYSFKQLRQVAAAYAQYNHTIGPNNGEVAPGASIQSDDDIVNYIRDTAIPVWHACGTCAMLPEDKGGVVNNELQVYGVRNLRIADASIFPVIPDAHLVAVVYMVAEKLADILKAAYAC